jgi:putative PIN family toxin of toxin-antitoxin system
MRVVVDTNELLRMAAGGERSKFAQHWRHHRFDMLMSLSTLTELRTVLSRSKVQRYIPANVGDAFLGLVESRASFVQPDLSAPTCRDPQDSALIATAVGGQAEYLVSADPDILDDEVLREALVQRGVHIIRATEFLQILESSQQ